MTKITTIELVGPAGRVVVNAGGADEANMRSRGYSDPDPSGKVMPANTPAAAQVPAAAVAPALIPASAPGPAMGVGIIPRTPPAGNPAANVPAANVPAAS